MEILCFGSTNIFKLITAKKCQNEKNRVLRTVLFLFIVFLRKGALLYLVRVDTEKGSLHLDEDFLVDFGDEPEGPVLAHEVNIGTFKYLFNNVQKSPFSRIYFTIDQKKARITTMQKYIKNK